MAILKDSIIDGVSFTDLNVVFKDLINSTTLPSGTTPSNKVNIAFGYGIENASARTTSTATTSSTATDRSYHITHQSTGASWHIPHPHERGYGYGWGYGFAYGYGFGYGFGFGYGYGFGYESLVAIRDANQSSWTTYHPTNVVPTWSHYLEITKKN